MKIINTYKTIAVALLAFTLLTACQRTELCYDHYPKATLTFEWEQEWERDYGMAHRDNWDESLHGFEYDHLRPGTPEWVNLIKYRNDSSEGEHYLTPAGGDIPLMEEGGYSFLLYNGDTEYVVLSDIASLPEARASATPRSRTTISHIMEKHPGTRTANPPDVIYAAYLDNVPTIGVHQNVHLPFKMQPLVYTYVIRYEFEEGLEFVTLARGALAGMAESVYLRDGKTSETPIIILYDCEIKDYGCEAHVRSFGVPGFPDEYYGRAEDDSDQRPYTLNLEVMLTNGLTMHFDYDVADQIRKQPRGGVITVSGLRINADDAKTEMSGGFDVDLSGWSQEDIDLPLDPPL